MSERQSIEGNEKPAVRPGIAKVGAALSFGYLTALLIYAIVQRGPFLAMRPNEFADFLAGAFAPLAFLWLVLGFIQQGQELRISSDALRLQGDELRNSVEQQRQLVEVSRLQLESEADERRRAEADADLQASPKLHFTAGGAYAGQERVLDFRLHSGGPTCSNVEIDFPAGPKRVPLLDIDKVIHWRVRYDSPEEMKPFDASVSYTDIRGNRRTQKFHFGIDPEGGPHGNGAFVEPVRVG